MFFKEIRQLVFSAFILAAVFALDSGQTRGGETFRESQLTVTTATGVHALVIEIAETPVQRTQGLQGRQNLAVDTGMLFDFGELQHTSMWMKNTFISLDMLFIDGDGTIVSITRNTEPHSLTMITSSRPVKGVLEVRAGTVARLGIRSGDRVSHPILR